MIYIAVLNNSTESLQNHSTILPLFIGPHAAATVRHFSMKALARYQVILLGEQRHVGVNNLPRVVARIMLRPDQTRDLSITSLTSYHYTTAPPNVM